MNLFLCYENHQMWLSLLISTGYLRNYGLLWDLKETIVLNRIAKYNSVILKLKVYCLFQLNFRHVLEVGYHCWDEPGVRLLPPTGYTVVYSFCAGDVWVLSLGLWNIFKFSKFILAYIKNICIYKLNDLKGFGKNKAFIKESQHLEEALEAYVVFVVVVKEAKNVSVISRKNPPQT